MWKLRLSQRYQDNGFVQVIQVILKMEEEGNSEPLTRVYWATSLHVSEARTSYGRHSAAPSSVAATYTPPTATQETLGVP